MTNEARLLELRGQVDGINLQLLELLNQRARVVSEIGKVQAAIGAGFYDPAREAQMLQALEMANNGPFSNEAIKTLFKEIFRASMALEESQAKAKLKVQRKSSSERTVITMPDGVTTLGGGDFKIIAGPCAVESFEQMDETAAALAQRGVKFLRGMAYKPRTSPYEFQGLGEEGLKIARRVADKYGQFIVSEIMDKSQLQTMYDYVDVFWVGARNMQNAYLLKALGQQNKPIILKHSFGATMEEFLYAAEYIVASGNPNVMLIERGIRTFEKWTRASLDIGAVAALKLETHLPIIIDISHSAGRRDIAIPMAKAAKAVGVEGLMVEVHPNPPVAMSDSKQQLYIPQFHELMDALGD
ncbi:MAG: bifunctional 3-deoxy-7-phosphoheptulonate synthase/chorismate mutase [Anaerolineae bacterium]|jgi:3-deoxy-7-phosphoheptulonate synthase/chorismate mutase|nr:bifunctional 3-deoxy-7-phosphoheptulonate synthase/chorismate mutase [Anaerolineae bacterium]